MKILKNIVAFFFLLFSVVSCIDNDMSLPRVLARFMKLEVEGGIGDPVIDVEKRTVSITVDEESELSSLKVKECVLNEKAFFKQGSCPEVLDLTKPMEVVLSMYQDYDWTISATQPVERYVNCTNQIGASVVNTDDRKIYVYISKSQRLQTLEVKDVKFERVGSQVLSTEGVEIIDSQTGETGKVKRDCLFPMILDCNSPRTFEVSFQGQTTVWTLVTIPIEVAAEVKGVDARCYYADLIAVYGGGDAVVPVFEYKPVDAQEWITIPQENVEINGVDVNVHIPGLTPQTEYFARAIVDDEILPEVRFKTCSPTQLYNMSFDEWWLNGKVWNPYLQGMSPNYWDSANPGAANYIGSSTTPDDDIVALDYPDDGKERKSVKMVSKDATIAFAAGNIYTGKFLRVSGIGAILDWGVEFDSKPLGLKGYYKYIPQAITNTMPPYENMMGQPDKCQIQIFITDWDEPFTVNTTKGQFVDIQNDEHIIAYGKIETGETISEYREFYIPLEYRDRTRTPKYIVISCCASYLGDYFTGGVGSTLYVDEFSLVYDQPSEPDDSEDTEEE